MAQSKTPKGRAFNPLGPDFVTVTLNGQEVRPKDTTWVVWDPQGEPVGYFESDTSIRTDVARAARVYWSGSTPAILALNEGYKITLVTNRTFLREVAAKLAANES